MDQDKSPFLFVKDTKHSLCFRFLGKKHESDSHWFVSRTHQPKGRFDAKSEKVEKLEVLNTHHDRSDLVLKMRLGKNHVAPIMERN